MTKNLVILYSKLIPSDVTSDRRERKISNSSDSDPLLRWNFLLNRIWTKKVKPIKKASVKKLSQAESFGQIRSHNPDSSQTNRGLAILVTPNRNLWLTIAPLVVSLFVLGNNLALADKAQTSQISADSLSTVDPQTALTIVSQIEPYTPTIEEDPKQVEIVLSLSKSSGYLQKPQIVQTQVSEDIPKVKRQSEYIVQADETMAVIAYKFNLKISSLKYVNNLESEALSPGQVLKIPSSDIPDSVIAAAARAKEEKRLAALRAKEAEKKKKLARFVTFRERSAASFDGDFEGGFIVPISHKGISRGVSGGHSGIDYRADIGTPVRAAASGVVVEITRGWGSGFGLSVLVDHGGGRNSRYAHLSGFAADVGQPVSQGQVIGYSGSSGWSTGPHLHFEVHAGGRVISPF